MGLCFDLFWLEVGRRQGTRRLMKPGRKKLKKEGFLELEISSSFDVFMHR